MSVEFVAIGRINIDIVIDTDKLPKSSDHLVGFDGQISFGGSASNFASQSAKLGVKAGLVSCIGDDIYGQIILKELSKIGVDTKTVLVLENQPTGVFMLVRSKSEGSFVVSQPGANKFLNQSILDVDSIGRTRVIHVAGGFQQMATQAVKVATTNGIMFSLDPGRTGHNIDFSQVLPHTDLLFLNRSELKQHFKLDPKRSDLIPFAKTFPGIVIVKQGREGAIATDGFEYYESPVFEVPVKDTLGAGDAFAAGFITAWTRAENIERALHMANAVAALTITEYGAQKGQPSLNQTAGLLKKFDVDISAVLRTFGSKRR
ncbi:MAG: hypothetical protein BAJATHORv1_20153 [Candidatus Thorarchaeota archaeon]|nr:MAG: hypothetical protein BAJATHORv1_20153 [Candidatus Thorarchaeota archaeon]